MESNKQTVFQQKFVNHKNSVVKIINNTFKKIKSTKEDQETRNKVLAFKEDQRARKDLAKL